MQITLKSSRCVFLSGAAIVLMLVSLLHAQDQPLPKPQIAETIGEQVPDFTLKDQDGNEFHLAAHRGERILLYFYRGYWCPYCMMQMKEFSKHKEDLDKLNTHLVCISVDDKEHARLVWDKVANRQFTFLSDPGAKVIHQYGLLHSGGSLQGDDIAIRTTMFIDEQGRQRWRRVSTTVGDIPTMQEILDRIRDSYK